MKRLIITEEEKKEILGKYNLIYEAFDENTKTYKTEGGLVMYGDGYSSGNASTLQKMYVVKFPTGSKASLTTSNSGNQIKLEGGNMTKPNQKTNITVTLPCNSNKFLYYNQSTTSNITLYWDKMDYFVNKLKKYFCQPPKDNQVKNNPATNVKTNDIACKKDTPYNVVTKAGLNWNTVKQAWGSTGTDTENIALRNAVCDGWRPGNPKPGTVSTTGTTETPTYENVKKTYENQLISAFIDEKKYGAEYKDPGMKDQFFNDYETEYREWTKSKGLLDPTGNVKLEDLTKIYNFLTNLQKR